MRDFDWGAREGRPNTVTDRVLTAPNAITLVRLLGLPLFVWLVLGPQAYGQAFAVLAAVGGTDWVDGYVARRFDQVSRLGQVLDPLVDRALLATVGVTLLLAGFLPWWLLAAILLRDVLLLGGALAVFRGIPDIPVTKTGKFATACLLVALPGFLLGHMQWPGRVPLLVAAWAYAAVGVTGYWIAGAQYARVVWRMRAGEADLPR